MRSTEVLVREQYEKLAATKERFKEVGNGIMFQSVEQMLLKAMHKYATAQELPLLM